MTDTCRHIQPDLKAFCDGELPLVRHWLVRRHLQSCPICQNEVETMKTVSHELQNSEEHETIPASLRAKLVNVAGAPPVSTHQSKPRTSPSTRSLIFNSALGVALILIMSVGTMTMLGKRVQTVFNNAQASLNTSIDGDYTPQTDSTFGNVTTTPNYDAPDAVYRNRTEASSSAASTLTRRVHNEASISVAVSDLESKSSALEQMTKSVGGFVASNDLSSSGNTRRASLVIKVPVQKFDEVLRKIGEYGLVKSKSVKGEDITTRVSDAMQEKNVLSQELATKMAELRKKRRPDAQTQYEARTIRIQLAQAQARLEILEKMARLSTINVQLQEKPKPAHQAGFVEELDKTKTAATSTFLTAARWPIMALMWIVAYAPLWIPLLLIWRYANHAYFRRT